MASLSCHAAGQMPCSTPRQALPTQLAASGRQQPWQSRCRRRIKTTAAAGGRQQELASVAAASPARAVADAPSRSLGPVSIGLAAAAALAALTAGGLLVQRLASVAAFRRHWRRRRKQQQQAGSMSGLIRPAKGEAQEDSREFKMALARTRQAVAVNKAVGFMRTGDNARAMVELRRALHENSVCRAPLLNTMDASREDRLALYMLHLRNTIEGPATSYATLLQLRTLLDLSFEESEQAEQEVNLGSAYSI